MKKITALLGGALTLAMLAAPAIGGVVITQQITKSGGYNANPNAAPTEETVMVQGGKQKVIDKKFVMIIDADNSTMYVLNPESKIYYQQDFPTGKVSTLAASASAAKQMKKTGQTRTVAGYKCVEYTGSGHVMRGDFTMTECLSTEAPGAAEWAAYQKMFSEKTKGAQLDSGGEIPDGIPLESNSSLKLGTATIPGMSAEQTAQFHKMLANRPPNVMKTAVTKVVVEKLSPDTFEVPKDYTKRELPAMPSMSAAAAAAAAHPGAAASPAGPH
jgi:hypothetical protein